ncbi:MAG: 4,5-DOPA dioxygenase extradiol [Steroidobacterales bacterium]
MTQSERMPVIFVGHGNPMNALARNQYTEGWRELGISLPRPRAIVCVSAHWYVPRVAVTAMARPRTIHDFGGFPPKLYEVAYPAPGSPELARRISEIMAPVVVELDQSWGLDHGTWSVLTHVYPDASIPVVQLSIDDARDAAAHYAIAQRLAPLRDEGILIVGSGNIVHNLHAYAWGDHSAAPYDWALRFDRLARQLLAKGDFAPLIDYESLGRDALLAAPTPDHYLPLLYVMAQRRADESVSFPVAGFDGGSISMLSVRIG